MALVATATEFGSLYLGNKMSGVPFFNAPWFDAAERTLRKLPGVRDVFNPAQHDRDMGFDPMNCPNGSKEEAVAAGFAIRKALGADWAWIAENSNGMIAGPSWARSPGTISEIACHQALGLPVWEWGHFLAAWSRPDVKTCSWTLPALAEYLG